ncbi:hypothetical protein [Legionella drozanskii]|uniref:Uncharacterized protein n=1 Tax=Legionella drozanskii LLAP-1 TaxID=1212489 RepID=A0A0W0T0T4_9GAMM|nr:hypothetical protein [Legionella drozanskii]KTC89178.1 hypothetical protein Ldro_0758 [Legionella drozanskii LLAP-1]
MNNSYTPKIEHYNFLTLLPYDENTQFINKQQKLDGLYLAQKVIASTVKALEAFLKGHLVAFDAQLGENLCQIRAYRLLHLARKWLHNPAYKSELQQQIEAVKVHQILLDKTILNWQQSIQLATTFDKNLDSKENIADFFARHELLFGLHEELVFMITCHFLTHFNIRVNNIPVAINLNQIADEYMISKHRAKRLSHYYQQIVCKLGCHFIMQIATELPEHDYKEILPSLYKIADEGRAVLPCHLVSEVIFNHAILKKIPILLKIHRFCAAPSSHYDTILFNFLGNKKNEIQFTLMPCEENYEHCLVVSGEVLDEETGYRRSPIDYIAQVLDASPLKLILANTAIHPQYSGKQLAALRHNPFQALFLDSGKTSIEKREKELALMQKFALESGCSQQNPTLFFLKHIYANTFFNEINDLNSIHTGCAYEALEEKSKIANLIGQLYEKKGIIRPNSDRTA